MSFVQLLSDSMESSSQVSPTENVFSVVFWAVYLLGFPIWVDSEGAAESLVY